MSPQLDAASSTFLELRRQLFQKPDELRGSVDAGNGHDSGTGVVMGEVLGVILETPTNAGCTLVYALIDGSTGVFPGHGGQVDHGDGPIVSTLAEKVCQLAASVVTRMDGSSGLDHPPPPLLESDYWIDARNGPGLIDARDGWSRTAGHENGIETESEDGLEDEESAETVQISVLTTHAIHHSRAHDLRLSTGQCPLSALYLALLDLQSAVEDSPEPRPRSAGPTRLSTHMTTAFANCLLTCLAHRRAVAESVGPDEVVIYSDRPLPPLEPLARAGEDLDWVRRHPFRNVSIRADDVIDIVLAESTRPRLFGKRRKLHTVLETQHGPREHDFDLTLTEGPSGARSLTITAAHH